MNLRELGRTAGEELLGAIEGRPSPGLHTLACRLVVRESTAPSRANGGPAPVEGRERPVRDRGRTARA